jgi:tetratricopeptide (TPR) repeat protein
MDDRQLEAYLNLIRSLLNCPSGEEAQILQANSELVDAGLVQVMQVVAENERDKGNENAADFLTNLANQLAEGLKLPSANSQLDFLLRVLQVTEESDGNPNVIYPLLRDNLKLINDNLAAIMRNRVKETLLNLDNQERRIFMTAVLVNFSNAIQQFSLGSIASNIEISIAGYEVALAVLTRQEYTENWAINKNNLAAAYSNRIRGEKADNLEKAIEFYQAALEVRTREQFPQDWAMYQNNLATAYYGRIRGERADNLEQAIEFYEASLEVRTREAFPEQWAMTQNNLAAAYSNRIRGEKTDNLEKAIEFYQLEFRLSTN